MQIHLQISLLMQLRFNKQFLDSQLGGNPTTVGIGKMLTVMSEQDNTIRALSRILGRDYNEFVYKGSHIYNPKILDKPYS